MASTSKAPASPTADAPKSTADAPKGCREFHLLRHLSAAGAPEKDSLEYQLEILNARLDDVIWNLDVIKGEIGALFTEMMYEVIVKEAVSTHPDIQYKLLQLDDHTYQRDKYKQEMADIKAQIAALEAPSSDVTN